MAWAASTAHLPPVGHVRRCAAAATGSAGPVDERIVVRPALEEPDCRRRVAFWLFFARSRAGAVLACLAALRLAALPAILPVVFTALVLFALARPARRPAAPAAAGLLFARRPAGFVCTWSAIDAWAAASRAIGTRYGLQET